MKILGSDFDGTLNFGGFEETKYEAIRAWRAAGNRFGLVSGRGPSYLNHLREEYPALEMDFFVAYNGAFIVDAEGAPLDTTLCETVPAAELTEALLGWGCPEVFVNGEGHYTVRRDGEALAEGECTLSELPRDPSCFHQISVCLDSVDEAAAVTHKLLDTYGDRLNPLQNGRCIDIVASSVNKAYGLRRLAACLGYAESEIIAVGDNLNDLDMLKAFPSYAMENGVEEVKRAAGRTVQSVTDLIRQELALQGKA